MTESRTMTTRSTAGVCLLALTLASCLPAAPPIDRVLPATTKEFVAIPSVANLQAAFARTNYGRLFDDPAMKDFRDALGPTSWLPGVVCARLKLTPDEIKEMSGGGAGWAYVQPAADQAAQVVWIDTAGKADARKRWADACAARLKKAGGKVTSEKVGTTDATLYQTARGEKVFSVLRGDLLLLSDHAEVLADVLDRHDAAVERPGLADAPAYQAVRKRLGDMDKADVFAYLDPIGRVEIQRVYRPTAAPKAKDLVAILKKQGVAGVAAVGASLRLDDGPHDLFFHVAVHTPRPLEGGMGVLRFKSGDNFAPEPWVPAEVASFVVVHLDIPAAFDQFGPIYDALSPSGKDDAWKAWLKELKDAPNGPRLDLRRDVVARLDSRVLFLSAPPDKSDRLLIAIPVQQPAEVGRALKQLFENDDGAALKKVAGHDVWVVEALARKKGQPPARTIFAVADGLFYLSNQADVLEAVLTRGGRPGLADVDEYRRVAAELERLVPRDARVGSRAFTRPELDYRTVYEAARKDTLDDLNSLNGRLAAILFGASEDLDKLPPFAKVAGYLKPMGSVGLIHDDGWEILGFTLAK